MVRPVGRAFLAGSYAGVLLYPQPTEICHLENPLRSRRRAADRATSSPAARDNFCCVPGNSPVCVAG
jgi:hypothetical protein